MLDGVHQRRPLWRADAALMARSAAVVPDMAAPLSLALPPRAPRCARSRRMISSAAKERGWDLVLDDVALCTGIAMPAGLTTCMSCTL